MTARYGLENHEIGFDAAWVADNVDAVLWSLEEPPLAMPAFGQHRVFELCRQDGATVVLDGQGADEIFAGYQYHQRIAVKELLRRGRVVAAWRELRAIGRMDQRSATGLFADWFVKPYLRRTRPPIWITPSPPDPARFAPVERGRDRAPLNRQLYYDVRWANAKIILGYADRNAMAHSIEARVPYFDRQVVEFAFGLPTGHKIARGDRKRVLRDVARRYVPKAITERPDRMGFGTPDEAMIAGPLLPVIRDALADPDFRASGWIDAAEADRFLLDFAEGRHHDHRAVWRLFMLSRWARRFGVRG
jgi:asparagine synthase (glutamine-hydrolysing)